MKSLKEITPFEAAYILHQKHKFQQEKDYGKEECSICYGMFDELKELPICGHKKFCHTCVGKMMYNTFNSPSYSHLKMTDSHHFDCPLCRAPQVFRAVQDDQKRIMTNIGFLNEADYRYAVNRLKELRSDCRIDVCLSVCRFTDNPSIETLRSGLHPSIEALRSGLPAS